ncbi:MAG: hypothetical protein Q8R39_00950 [bacterium]|nr:hypothetical protein [bacterium]
MEISREVLQDLMERVHARHSAKFRQKAKEEPEVYLVALLLQVADEVDDPRKSTHAPEMVGKSTNQSRVQQAREFLTQLSETAPCP